MNQADPELIVLLAEDSPDDAFFFHRALKKAGVRARVYVVEDGLQGIHYLSRQGEYANAAQFPFPDLLFLDLKMPNVNGSEFLRWIRQQQLPQPLTVVVLSSSQEPKDVEEVQQLGAYSYLLKPPQPNQLTEIFQQLLAGKMATVDSAAPGAGRPAAG